MKHRLFNKWYANLFGYFWLPCILCGKNFGGHEWLTGGDQISSVPHPDGRPGHGIGICPDCTRAGRGRDSY